MQARRRYMPWVITKLCRDCVDQSCVEVCPVDCIYGYAGEASDVPNQLFINPEECIDCGVCEPECPWEAIYEDERVPEVFVDDVESNARVAADQDSFAVPEVDDQAKPSEDQIKANKEKWNLTE